MLRRYIEGVQPAKKGIVEGFSLLVSKSSYFVPNRIGSAPAIRIREKCVDPPDYCKRRHPVYTLYQGVPIRRSITRCLPNELLQRLVILEIEVYRKMFGDMIVIPSHKALHVLSEIEILVELPNICSKLFLYQLPQQISGQPSPGMSVFPENQDLKPADNLCPLYSICSLSEAVSALDLTSSSSVAPSNAQPCLFASLKRDMSSKLHTGKGKLRYPEMASVLRAVGNVSSNQTPVRTIEGM